MKRIVIIVSLLSVVSLFIYGDKTYSLKDLEKLMLSGNLPLKISEIDLKIATIEYKEAGRLENPVFEYERGKAKPMEGGKRINIWGYSLGVELPNPISWIYKRKSEKMSLLKAENSNQIRRIELKSQLRRKFYKLQLLLKKEELRKNRLKSLEKIGKIARIKADVGETKEIEALRASVEIQKIRTGIFRIEKEKKYTMLKIRAFLNEAIPGNFSINQDFNFTPTDNLDMRIGKLFPSIPVIKEQFLSLKEADNNKKSKISGLFPNIEIKGVRGREPDAKIWKLSAGIKIPLFNSGILGIKKASLQKEKVEIRKRFALMSVKAEIEGLIFRLKSAEKEIRTFSASILAEGRENLKISEELYKSGELPLIIYLDAQNSWLEMEEGYYNSITQWKLIRTEIEKMIGVEL